MKDSVLRVLEELRKAKNRGISWDSFPKGCAIRSRISDLRKMGYDIRDEWEHLSDRVKRKRYYLIKERETV